MSPAHLPSTFGNFVGRELELVELKTALGEASTGRGRLYLLSGEPGIGKTRLAEEVARDATALGMRTVWGRCWEGDGAPAYWPWIQVIRGCLSALDPDQRRALLEAEHASSMVPIVGQLVPELHSFASHPHQPPMTSRLEPEQMRFRLFDSVATLLKEFARIGPMVIVLDDLHEADLSSLAMLRFVARELSASAVFMVGTYRDVEVQRSRELSQHIGGLGREGRSIPLVGLSEAEVAQFYGLSSGSMPDHELAAKLRAATAGNPLFVDGIVRMLIADRDAGGETASSDHFKIPNTIREAIQRRLAALSDETRSLLNVVATIGNEFETDTGVRVAGVSREDFNSCLDEASRAGIVAMQGQSRYRFVHALIRAALYEALDTNTRIRLHARLGETIEEIYAKDLKPHLAELAHHFREAGMREKAIEYFHRAAKAANAVSAYTLAAERWREALALSEGQNDARRAGVLFGLGRLAAFFLNPAEGVACLEAALSLYRELQDEEKVAVVNATLGLALSAHHDYAPEMNVPRALEHFRRARSWEGVWTNRGTFGWLHQGMALALFQGIRIDEGIAAAKQARQAFERESNPAWMVSASVHAQYLVIKGKHRAAALLFEEVAAVAADVADPEVFRSAMWYPGWCRMLMRDPLEAKRLLTLGMERPGLTPHQRERHFEFLALIELLMGNLSKAKALAAEHRVNPTFRSSIAFREGNWEAAIEMHLTMLKWTGRTGHRWNEANTLSILFDVIRVTGDLDRATEVFRRALQSYDPGTLLFEMNTRPQGVLLALEAGRRDEAIDHLKVCRTILGQGEDWAGRVGLVARAEAMLAAAAGRDFTAHFTQAIEIFKRYGLGFDEADTLDYWGRALLAVGNRTEAEAKFDAAIRIYRRCGAGQRWIDRVEAAKALLSAAPGSGRSAPASLAPTVFRQEGDFWTITYGGKTSRLRSLKGLNYIALLLAHPGVRIHVCDLVAMVEGGAEGLAVASHAQARSDGLAARSDLGDAGEALDPRTITRYRRRSIELRDELAEAEKNNDPGAIDRARRELELLNDQLAAGVGRGGRSRRTSSHVERARALVTKNIRGAVERIRHHDPQLGKHFATSIRTGAFCAYLPELADLEDKPAWQI